MTRRFSFLLSILLAGITVLGQDITRRDADSMLAELKNSKQDLARIDLLLNLAQYHIFKPGELKTDLDSATVYINEAEALNKSVKSADGQGYLILTQSYLTKEKGQKDEGKKMAEKAVNILEAGKNKSYLGKAYYELSQYYDCFEDTALNIMIPLVERSIDAFQQAGNMERKAFSLKMLGDLLNLDDKNDEAIVALQRALAVYDSIHYPRLQEVYGLLGRVYDDKGNHKQSLMYNLLALKTAEVLKDSSMTRCEILNNLGILYRDREELEVSNNYFKAALEVAKLHDDNFTVLMLTWAVAAGYSALKRPDAEIEFLKSTPKKYLRLANDEQKLTLYLAYLRAYRDSNEPDKAQPYCDLLLKLVNSKEISTNQQSAVYREVAAHYMKLKNYAAARKYLAKNNVFANEIGRYRVSLDLYLWYKLDSAQGNFRDAFNHLLQYKNISDSLLNASKTKQFQQLEVEYDTDKKQDSIKLIKQDISLLTKDNNLQQVNLNRARIIKNVTIAGIILAFIITGLLYRQYRLKQKSNNIISDKNEMLQHLVNEKDWLVKEIHHRVKNNLHTVMGLLGTQAGYLKNQEAITAITDSQHRIQSMSLVHQRLYQSNNLSAIKMTDYIHELVDSLSDSFNTGNHILFNLDIEPIELDLAHCIPMGLILNEAITNSFKYAFPAGQQGLISIAFRTTSEDNFLLSINDNGIGLPRGFNVRRSDSMGMNLMRGLSEELGAEFIISGENGTRIDISFVYHPDIANEVSQTITETDYQS